jgi:tellurite resistance protein
MDAYLTDKLSAEIERYGSKDFLKAAMGVYVLTAYADGHMGLLERSRIDLSLMTEPGLKEFDFKKATETLEGYAAALVQEGESAERILRNKVAGMAGNHKLARTLMRLSYIIITADRRIEEAEVEEFRRLCDLLELDPDEVWEEVELTAE